MKKRYIIFIAAIVFIVLVISIIIWNISSRNEIDEKGFAISNAQSNTDNEYKKQGINKDSLKFETRPCGVLLTGVANIRLTTLYKINKNKQDGTTFIGSDDFLYKGIFAGDENNWNGNLMPGFEGVYGYNLVNISLYDHLVNKSKMLFEKPVLIKTVYYPTTSKDTLNNKIIKRNFMMISVYNEDTNKDRFINQKDLRRFYHYNINGERQKALVPENYSVFKSEYDPENDLMFVFGRFDKNANGQIEDNEPINIFWIDLKDPSKTGQQY